MSGLPLALGDEVLRELAAFAHGELRRRRGVMRRLFARRIDQRNVRGVAHGPHAVFSRHAHEAVGLDAPPMHGEPERLDQRIGSVADRGDDGARRDHAAVGELHRRRGGGLGADAGLHLDAVQAEPPGRIFGEIGRESRQDPVGIFDEMDADLVLFDVGIIFERAADQLVDLGHGLHAREARAHDDEGEELLLDVGIDCHVRHLKAADDVGAQTVRVGQVLHGERVLGQAGEALEVHAHAERDHELVVTQLDRQTAEALHHDHHLAGEVDAHDLGLADLHAAEQEPQRRHRVGGMDGGGRDLGQERLEHEIIIVVDELDVEPARALARQLLGGKDAAETAAENEDLGLVHAGAPSA